MAISVSDFASLHNVETHRIPVLMISLWREEYFDVAVNAATSNSSVTVLHVLDDVNQDIMGQNVILWKVPKYLHALVKDARLVILSIEPLLEGALEVTLRTEDTVLYVSLTCSMQGRFEDNLFSMPAGSTKVRLKRTVRI